MAHAPGSLLLLLLTLLLPALLLPSTLACPRTSYPAETALAPRGSISLPSYLPGWNDAIVPFQTQNLGSALAATVAQAMRAWEQGTCVRFVKRVKGTDKQWLHIKSLDYRGQCFTETSPNARGEVLLVLGDNAPRAPPCTGLHDAAHELGHVLGLIHEFQRPDRDAYVTVPAAALALAATADSDAPWRDEAYAIVPGADSYGLPFHEASVMNYDTVTSRKTGQLLVPSDVPTGLDKATINAAYSCDEIYTRSVPDVYDALESPAERWQFSTYEFVLDFWTDTFMTLHGYGTVGVRQFCRGDDADSNNWAFAPHVFTMANQREHTPYRVEVDPCAKGESRHPAGYEIALCKGESEEDCDIRCGVRNLRSIDPVTKGDNLTQGC